MKDQRKKLTVLGCCIALLLCGCSNTATEPSPASHSNSEKIPSASSSQAAPVRAVPTQLSEIYADFENPSFEWEGKLYTLGQFTLQDLLDAGAIFCDDGYLLDAADMPDPEERIKAGWVQGYDILITEGSCFSVTIRNYSDEPKKAADCTVTDFDMWTNEGEPQDRIRFACPYDATWDQIIDNSGPPTEISGDDSNGSLDYIQYADEEHPHCIYYFSFYNGMLAGFGMTWTDSD